MSSASTPNATDPTRAEPGSPVGHASTCLRALLLVRARRLHALVLGEEAGAALGVNASRLRWQLLIVTTLLTGTVVAVSGGIRRPACARSGPFLHHSVRQ
ncbi:iron chelate uptake ABC transporter family permease subunit [Plantactinospora sp. WMMB782]|uniref:iron chelate uptake ABC transporter family permease subunit n=1 Tax=Plantactinospora sp. WMMB782 TaxID=3404121 RepID=UPI003B95F805